MLLTGMGRQNAETALKGALTTGRPELVITAGFAGALAPELASGTIVFGADGPNELQDRLRAAGALPVRFHCAERVVVTSEEKRALRAASGADAVEMESGYIEQLCQHQGVPSATVRIILDTAEEDLVLDFNQVMTPDRRIHAGKLALAVLKCPWRIPALLALQRQSARAARHLGQTLARVLGVC